MTLYRPPDSEPAISSRSCLPSGGISSISTLAMWKLFQTAVFTGVMWWADSWPTVPFAGPGKVTIAFMVTALATATVIEVQDWRQRRAVRRSTGLEYHSQHISGSSEFSGR